MYRRDQDSSHNGTFLCVCVLQQIRAADLLFTEGRSAPSSRNLFYSNPKHLASIQHDSNPVRNRVMYWSQSFWSGFCQEVLLKSILMALRERPQQSWEAAFGRSAEGRLAPLDFIIFQEIQPSSSLTDNIRSESMKSSCKYTLMALRERPELPWASAFGLFAEGRLAPSDFIILNPKHRQVSRDICSKGALQALSGSFDCDFGVTFHRIWNDNNSRSTVFF